MDMKTYLERSLKYMLRMVVIIGMVFAVMWMLNLLETGGQGLWKALMYSRNGAILIGVLVLLALIYPKLAFTAVSMRADIGEDRKGIMDAMKSYGYSPVREEEDIMVFRADRFVKKLAAQFDDAITFTRDGDRITIEGLKKDVLRLETRINAFIMK